MLADRLSRQLVEHTGRDIFFELAVPRGRVEFDEPFAKPREVFVRKAGNGVF